MKTSFQNVSYLEKALNKLKIDHQRSKVEQSIHDYKYDLIINK